MFQGLVCLHRRADGRACTGSDIEKATVGRVIRLKRGFIGDPSFTKILFMYRALGTGHRE